MVVCHLYIVKFIIHLIDYVNNIEKRRVKEILTYLFYVGVQNLKLVSFSSSFSNHCHQQMPTVR